MRGEGRGDGDRMKDNIANVRVIEEVRQIRNVNHMRSMVIFVKLLG